MMTIRISGSFGSLFCCFALLLAACGGGRHPAPLPASEILTSLRIVEPPQKTVYLVGEAFDPSGIVVEGGYADGSVRQIPEDELAFAGFDSSAPAAQQTVTVMHGGLAENFRVEIMEFEETHNR